MARAALVTGASRGIGAAIARRLAQDGFDVAIGCSTRRDEAERVAADVAEGGVRSMIVAGDLADTNVPARIIQEAVDAFGGLNLLVNNAGVVRGGGLAEVAVRAFDHEVAVNLRAPVLLSQAALPHLLRSKGCIVNISSLNGSRMPSRGAPVYSATKAGLDVMTRSFAAELGSRGVRVNCVSPGATRTQMFLDNAPPEVQDFFVGRTALGRLGEPEEVAAVVAFLASEDARWITGQIISASGGFE